MSDLSKQALERFLIDLEEHKRIRAMAINMERTMAEVYLRVFGISCLQGHMLDPARYYDSCVRCGKTRQAIVEDGDDCEIVGLPFTALAPPTPPAPDILDMTRSFFGGKPKGWKP